MQLSNGDVKALIRSAADAEINSYSPYSGYRVGAAVLTTGGEVYSGTNVENASYGLGVCAERIAVFNAISNGANSIRAVAVVCQKDPKCLPCGACLQVMSEFATADFQVILGSPRSPLILSMNELLPRRFKLPLIRRTKAR